MYIINMGDRNKSQKSYKIRFLSIILAVTNKHSGTYLYLLNSYIIICFHFLGTKYKAIAQDRSRLSLESGQAFSLQK